VLYTFFHFPSTSPPLYEFFFYSTCKPCPNHQYVHTHNIHLILSPSLPSLPHLVTPSSSHIPSSVQIPVLNSLLSNLSPVHATIFLLHVVPMSSDKRTETYLQSSTSLSSVYSISACLSPPMFLKDLSSETIFIRHPIVLEHTQTPFKHTRIHTNAHTNIPNHDANTRTHKHTFTR